MPRIRTTKAFLDSHAAQLCMDKLKIQRELNSKLKQQVAELEQQLLDASRHITRLKRQIAELSTK